jgi:MoaA/NifB/PqqE/SkfB family radical SAM enzyme
MQGYDSFCCFRSHAQGKPRVLWELNTACNLACGFCHAAPNTDPGVERQRIFEGIKRLHERGVGGIIFSGGEPLLRSDLFDILDIVIELGMEVDLCTNGLLVDAAMAERLAKRLTEISVSLDTDDPELHDRLRGRAGAWRRTLDGIGHLQGAGLEIHVITVVTDETISRLLSTAKFLDRLGVHSVTFLGLMPFPGDSHSSHRLSPPARAQCVDLLPIIRQRVSRLIVNSKCVVEAALCRGCGAGSSVLGVDANGTLLPCILLKGLESARPLVSSDGRDPWHEGLLQFEWLGQAFDMRTHQGGCVAYPPAAGETGAPIQVHK